MKTILVVGASRGLGLGLAAEYLNRGWQVIATARGQSSGLNALKQRYAARLEIQHMDITIADDISVLRERLSGRHLDILFINAGTAGDPHETIAQVTSAEFQRVMLTNALSPMRVLEAFFPLVSTPGTVAIMSSGLGSVANNETGRWEVYRASKAALNTLMRSFAARHAEDPRTLLLVSPGWVRTDMGGPHASLGVEESVSKIADMMARNGGNKGLQFLNYRGEAVRW